MRKALTIFTALVILTGCGTRQNTPEIIPNTPEITLNDSEPGSIQDKLVSKTKSLKIAYGTFHELQNASETHQNADTATFEEKTSILSTDTESSRNEAYMLSRLAMAEAEGEPLEGKAWVIMVVLNRVESPDFPDTVEEVIFQPEQFSSVWDGRYDAVEPNEDCRLALEMVIEGWDESYGALYFEAVSNDTDTWHSRNLQYIETVGNHDFYR